MAGPKVQLVEESPAAQVVARAQSPVVIHDDTGRAITLRKPGVLAQFRLIEALGDTARNEVYVRMVMPLLYVAEINGEPTIPLSTKSIVEAMVQQLDEAGVAAVMEGVRVNYGARDPEADKVALKN